MVCESWGISCRVVDQGYQFWRCEMATEDTKIVASNNQEAFTEDLAAFAVLGLGDSLAHRTTRVDMTVHSQYAIGV